MNQLTRCRIQQEAAQALYAETQDSTWNVVAEIFGELYSRLLWGQVAPTN